MSRLADAAAWAVELHDAQRRKGKDVPYTSHLFAVASLVLEHGGTEDQAIAALLHDSIEDQDVAAEEIEARFGATVRAIVEACTDGEPGQARDRSTWQERKEAYIEHLRDTPAEALLVSLADKTHNARSIADDIERVGVARAFAPFSGGVDGTRWYYRSLHEVFTARSSELPPPEAGRDDAGLGHPGGAALLDAFGRSVVIIDG